MTNLPGGLTPPLFGYEIPYDDPNGLILIYDSARHLCPVLRGAIEGAAARYRVKYITETKPRYGTSRLCQSVSCW